VTQPSPTTTTQTPLEKVVAQYRRYVHRKLDVLIPQVSSLRSAVASGDRAASQKAWLTAQYTWQQVGAAYGSFGDIGEAINGIASGLPLGANDPGFTGLHRIEYGLYNNQSMASVQRYVVRLANDVNTLQTTFDQIDIDPRDMPIRAHEILEDSLRDDLSDQSDYGSGMAYALMSGGILGTRALLDLLKPLIPTPVLGHSAYDVSVAALDVLDDVLAATKVHGQWPNYRTLSKHQRQPVNGALGAALEALYLVPKALEQVN
jgi:iron uptake system EfeUOB component EfeO/EfeM